MSGNDIKILSEELTVALLEYIARGNREDGEYDYLICHKEILCSLVSQIVKAGFSCSKLISSISRVPEWRKAFGMDNGTFVVLKTAFDNLNFHTFAEMLYACSTHMPETILNMSDNNKVEIRGIIKTVKEKLDQKDKSVASNPRKKLVSNGEGSPSQKIEAVLKKMPVLKI